MEEWKYATWVYPKVVGLSPPERWGHSVCYSHGRMFIFGGCRGGLYFGDVLVLDLESMVWTSLSTTGEGPGPRDSHSAVLFGNKMVVFGGTDGSRKVNAVHVLDLGTREWTRAYVGGKFPAPRESHTATLVGRKMVVFGGSGNGVGNYLNDVHVLDLDEMSWTSPEVKGEVPVPRDSHSAVVIGDRLFVYGGDCGDRYNGDVDVLDTSTMRWSKLAAQDPRPRVRAGHGAVALGNKMYIVGGIGDRRYYSDVWVLDADAISWSELSSLGEQPQGRFSHTAVAIGDNVVIYGGCGEDECLLNELLILKLQHEYSHNRNLWKRPRRYNIANNGANVSRDVLPLHEAIPISSIVDVESDPEEHSLTLSQNSSPSLSDQDQKTTPLAKSANPVGFRHLKWPDEKREGSPCQLLSSQAVNTSPKSNVRKLPSKHCLGEQQVFGRQEHQGIPPLHSGGPSQPVIGAEVRAKVDGAFDSGFLVTASINGKIFRGVLFAPVSISSQVRATRRAHLRPLRSNSTPPCFSQGSCTTVSRDATIASPQKIHEHRVASAAPGPPTRPHHQFIRSTTGTSSVVEEPKHRSDVPGVILSLTLGGPASGQI